MKKFFSILVILGLALTIGFTISTNYVKAADIVDVVYGETNSAVVGTSPVAGDTLVTFTETTALRGGDYIVLTFPAGTVLNTSNILASDFTIQEGTGTKTSPSVISVDAANRQIIMYIHAASLEDGMGAFTIKLSNTAAGNEIVNPTKITTEGVFTVATFANGVLADNGSNNDVTFTHDVANKYTIIDPTDGTVDAAIDVTVELQDQFGNIVTTGGDKDKDVTLVASGAATGEGLVDIVNGTGTLALTDHTAETVNLSLEDSEETGFDVSSTQDVVFAPGATTNIFISSEPTIAYTYVNLNPQPVVQLLDQYDNIVTTDDTSKVTIKAYSDNSCTTPATPDFTGNTGPVTVTDGVATFSGIKYNTINTNGIHIWAKAWTDVNNNEEEDEGEIITVCSESSFKVYASSSSSSTSSGSSTTSSSTTTTTTSAYVAPTTTSTTQAPATNVPTTAKPVSQMTQAEKTSYIMELQSYLINLLQQLLTALKAKLGL